ncbi:MAG: ABC transporter permease [Thermoleophilia bacterium]|nr:ABC transporter permease [Thermoleophilia bacterium]
MGSHSFITLLLVSAVAVGTPLLFAALGELISEISGVINIQLEGMMLCGAFFGVLGAYWTGGILGGFICAALGGALLALLHGVLCFVFRANQVVSGVILNIFALGVTSFLLSTVLASRVSKGITHLNRIEIPGLSSIPVIGPSFFNQDIMVYVGLLLVPVIWWMLTRTRIGLVLKAAGERPDAAESMGINIALTRWLALITCGCLAGIGGGQLAMAGIGYFTENMTAGVGFIALAAVIFGRWRAFGVLGAVLIFATADAFQIRADSIGIDIPYQFLAMLPYLITLLALAGLLKRMRPPAALATNYHPQD